MSYQVGLACYADLSGAGAAACAAFAPVTSILSDGSISTASCSSSDATGALILQVATVGATTSTTFRTLPVAFQPCQYGDYVDAGLTIFVALLVLWAALYPFKRIIDFLGWSRGSDV